MSFISRNSCFPELALCACVSLCYSNSIVAGAEAVSREEIVLKMQNAAVASEVDVHALGLYKELLTKWALKYVPARIAVVSQEYRFKPAETPTNLEFSDPEYLDELAKIKVCEVRIRYEYLARFPNISEDTRQALTQTAKLASSEISRVMNKHLSGNPPFFTKEEIESYMSDYEDRLITSINDKSVYCMKMEVDSERLKTLLEEFRTRLEESKSRVPKILSETSSKYDRRMLLESVTHKVTHSLMSFSSDPDRKAFDPVSIVPEYKKFIHAYQNRRMKIISEKKFKRDRDENEFAADELRTPAYRAPASSADLSTVPISGDKGKGDAVVLKIGATKLNKVVIDFGAIPHAEEIIERHLVMENDAAEPLKIVKAEATCSCFKGISGDMDIVSSGTGRITYRFDKSLIPPGHRIRTFTLETSSPANPKIEIEVQMDIEPDAKSATTQTAN